MLKVSTSAMISSRQFGDTRASVIHTGSLHFKPSYPQGRSWHTDDTPIDSTGRGTAGQNSLVIETSSAIVVIDPCSFRPDETSLYDGVVSAEPGPPLAAALGQLGIEPTDVSLVLVTHGHDDHFKGVLDGDRVRFPNAEHIFPQADREDLATGELSAADEGWRILSGLEAGGRVRFVSGDLDLDDGLSLMHTPGETRGHQVVRLDLGGERLYYVGDLFHFPIEVRKLRWAVTPRAESMYEDFEASRTRVLEEAASSPSTLVFTHGIFPAWGVADRCGPSSWTWRYI
jgi:glyoxylase-like metal-dependent hydrolase (beta-lactamase superfamily II)